ncbi:MAG: alpha-L-arabinofuranosidase C-terminal domain-containing protein [bacterium]|nr:alpha-L-arabinofuranosidase C-terminal domain-containing protein [bacterium]
MELRLNGKKKANIAEGSIGLFFEDINYAADGGLYAELLENRSFAFVDCYGKKGDYYTLPDALYAWQAVPKEGARLQIVQGSPLAVENPQYLRVSTKQANCGFSNKAYDGIYLEQGKKYRVTFYARSVSYAGDFKVAIQKGEEIAASASVTAIASKADGNVWQKYELELTAEKTLRHALFVLLLTEAGTVEFDFVSMMPKDAVAGVFRKDLFEKLKELKPGFMRFPGGCIIEGNTWENRYQYKDTLKPAEHRRGNWNRWAVHDNEKTEELHSLYSHYNQSYGLGFYEFFLLCDLIGAKPLPVLNVGLACQYQSYELVEMGTPAFEELLQDALDLIEFANGDVTTKWGALRAEMGHPAPFGLTMLGIGNEQWETEKVDFFARYAAFEKCIHEKYPEMLLIGSAGPDVTSKHYEEAWDFYHKKEDEPNFVYAVDEHYYVKPEWLYEHNDFYDNYSRKVKVFSGEYAAHPCGGMNRPDANTLDGALSEAAFLTGVERNADVVVLASYAPLFARVNYAQWSPDMIWFDEISSYATPSYYVQQMYSLNCGTITLDMEGQEKELAKAGVYVNAVLDEKSNEVIVKAVNRNADEVELSLVWDEERKPEGIQHLTVLSGTDKDAYNRIDAPDSVLPVQYETDETGKLKLAGYSFTVARFTLS